MLGSLRTEKSDQCALSLSQLDTFQGGVPANRKGLSREQATRGSSPWAKKQDPRHCKTQHRQLIFLFQTGSSMKNALQSIYHSLFWAKEVQVISGPSSNIFFWKESILTCVAA